MKQDLSARNGLTTSQVLESEAKMLTSAIGDELNKIRLSSVTNQSIRRRTSQQRLKKTLRVL
eukprot:snap_masked-scaffold_12-processed-gene-4.29-mRNA-1 protein AED:1.00 eAED:1.00 QI:0/-1/0/0/-1/1/1/0/61